MEDEEDKKPDFWQLFWLFLKISFFSFGGGNSMFSMIKSYCVDKYHFIKQKDIDDILIVTNSIPGASAIEGIYYISFLIIKSKRKAALITIFSLIPHTLLFLFLFILGINYIPEKYLKIIYVAVIPIIIALVLNLTIRYIKIKKNGIPVTIHWLIFVITLSFSFFVPVPWNIPIFIIIFFVICLLIFNFFKKRKNKKKEENKC
ncbi:MAG: chromate transporter [Metamycoplasmataceae bacterium]